LGYSSNDGIVNLGPGNLDATLNWWGKTNEAEIQGMVSDNVYFSPALGSDPFLTNELGLDTHVALDIKILSISVTPTPVDFGDPVPGATVVKTVLVVNTGDLDVDVTATLMNENPVNFYTTNLMMFDTDLNNPRYVTVVNWDLTLDTTEKTYENVDLQLSIPDPCLLGSKTAVLVFEATAPPP